MAINNENSHRTNNTDKKRNNYNNNRNGRNNPNTREKRTIPEFEKVAYLDDTNYVNMAKTVILHLVLAPHTKENRFTDEQEYVENIEEIKCKFDLTTTKIRSVLSLLNSIYQEIQVSIGDEIKLKQNKDLDKLSSEICGKIQYFKMRCAYEAGRENSVNDFIKKSNLMNYIDHINGSKKNFLLFFHYVEALVAYHRYFGGKE